MCRPRVPRGSRSRAITVDSTDAAEAHALSSEKKGTRRREHRRMVRCLAGSAARAGLQAPGCSQLLPNKLGVPLPKGGLSRTAGSLPGSFTDSYLCAGPEGHTGRTGGLKGAPDDVRTASIENAHTAYGRPGGTFPTQCGDMSERTPGLRQGGLGNALVVRPMEMRAQRQRHARREADASAPRISRNLPPSRPKIAPILHCPTRATRIGDRG